MALLAAGPFGSSLMSWAQICARWLFVCCSWEMDDLLARLECRSLACERALFCVARLLIGSSSAVKSVGWCYFSLVLGC